MESAPLHPTYLLPAPFSSPPELCQQTSQTKSHAPWPQERSQTLPTAPTLLSTPVLSRPSSSGSQVLLSDTKEKTNMEGDMFHGLRTSVEDMNVSEWPSLGHAPTTPGSTPSLASCSSWDSPSPSNNPMVSGFEGNDPMMLFSATEEPSYFSASFGGSSASSSTPPTPGTGREPTPDLSPDTSFSPAFFCDPRVLSVNPNVPASPTGPLALDQAYEQTYNLDFRNQPALSPGSQVYSFTGVPADFTAEPASFGIAGSSLPPGTAPQSVHPTTVDTPSLRLHIPHKKRHNSLVDLAPQESSQADTAEQPKRRKRSKDESAAKSMPCSTIPEAEPAVKIEPVDDYSIGHAEGPELTDEKPQDMIKKPEGDAAVAAPPCPAPQNRRGRKQTDSNDPTKQFKCDLCAARFRRQEHLKRHHRSLHTDDKPYKCDECNKGFSRSDNLTQHKRTHGSGSIALDIVTGPSQMSALGMQPMHALQHHHMPYHAGMGHVLFNVMAAMPGSDEDESGPYAHPSHDHDQHNRHNM